MKISINDGDDAINVHTLEELEEYMQKNPTSLLFWDEDDLRLAIIDDYVNLE